MLIADGSSFCNHCGTGVAAVQTDLRDLPCPACRDKDVHMVTWGLLPTEASPAGFPVAGCRSCGGAWVATETLDAIIATAAESAPVMPVHGKVKRRTMAPGPVVYRKCPRCDQMMARRNFAQISGIVIDECREHGSFFDAGELQDVLDFVRSGGLQAAKERTRQRDRQRERAERVSAGPMMFDDRSSFRMEDSPMVRFLRWAQGWLER
jgi:Zn-finger nucleic acid-binding protein